MALPNPVGHSITFVAVLLGVNEAAPAYVINEPLAISVVV